VRSSRRVTNFTAPVLRRRGCDRGRCRRCRGAKLGAALADQDVAGEDRLAPEFLHAEALAGGIPAIARGPSRFLVRHFRVLLRNYRTQPLDEACLLGFLSAGFLTAGFLAAAFFGAARSPWLWAPSSKGGVFVVLRRPWRGRLGGRPAWRSSSPAFRRRAAGLVLGAALAVSCVTGVEAGLGGLHAAGEISGAGVEHRERRELDLAVPGLRRSPAARAVTEDRLDLT